MLANRYQLDACLWEYAGCQRFRAWDVSRERQGAVEVRVLRGPLRREQSPTNDPLRDTDGFLLGADDDALAPPPSEGGALATAKLPPAARAEWPHPDWFQAALAQGPNRALPAVLDRFESGGYSYLVEEYPAGRPLMEAWIAPETTRAERFAWLIQIATAVKHLHRHACLAQGLRPEWVVVAADGRAVIRELTDLLPFPVPKAFPSRDSLYDSPELRLYPSFVDARSDLYGFGAMVYALYLARPLKRDDFTATGQPKSFLEVFPETLPMLGRLLGKTFRAEIGARFPTPATALEDASGFRELIQTLEQCRRRFQGIRYEIAAYTSTGMVRGGNEDAVAVLHFAEGRLDEVEERALILLADGMGGMECGEVAAGMAVQTLRTLMMQNPPFGALVNGSSAVRARPASDQTPLQPPNARRARPSARPGARTPPDATPLDDSEQRRDDRSQAVLDAIREANRRIYTAAREGFGVQGMGCTCELVLLEDEHLVIGHVGDSRVYLFRQGKLMQLTRDQTLVQRLVELGRITAEEAENHPRRAELQQALGGRPDVEADLVYATVRSGDWLLVCSDGLTGAIRPDALAAELALNRPPELTARRLVNRANLNGATDNVSLVLVRMYNG